MSKKKNLLSLISNLGSDQNSSPYDSEVIQTITGELVDLALLHADYTKDFRIKIYLNDELFGRISDLPMYITKLSQLANKQLIPKGTRLEVENIDVLEDPKSKIEFRVILADQSILERTQSISPTDSSQEKPYGFLLLTNGNSFELKLPIINIGREEGNTIVIEDPFISRNHCQIRLIKGTCWIFDKNSNSGTIINNEPISQKTLHPGDVIRLGKTDLIFGIDEDELTDTSRI